MWSTLEYIAQSMPLGASGYLLKDSSQEKIHEGIRIVYNYNIVLDRKISQAMLYNNPSIQSKSFNGTDYDLSKKENKIIVSADLNKLRSDGVLTRSIETNARSWQILGSVLAAFSLYNFISAMLIILLICLIFGITITQLPVIIVAILAFCIFNVGFTMVLFRLFKNDQVILMVGIVLSIVFVFLGIGIIDIPGLSFFEYVSPFYWLFESLDTGAILPNIPVIALYGLVLFTAGSFKVER